MKTLSIEDEKGLLRTHVRDLFGQTTDGERAFLSRQAALQFRQAPWLKKMRTILIFSALADEVNLMSGFGALPGKRLALPRFDRSAQTYCAALFSGRVRDLVPGQFRIPEPPPTAPCVALNELDLVLVPGVAFDRAGRRLGRGRGFYDRLLAEISGIKCGVAFDWQILPELPAEPHDITMDYLLTPSELFATTAVKVS